MKKFYSLLVVIMFFISAESQITYSAEKFSNPKKMHKKVVEVIPNFMVKHNVNKLQIIECVAEVSVLGKSKELSFSNPGNFSEYYSKKHPGYAKEIGENYLESVLDVLYNRFNKMISDNGLVPTEKNDVTGNAVYQKNKLQKTDYKKYDGSKIGNFNDKTSFIVSSSSMTQLPTGLDYNAAEEFNEELAHIASNNKADAALKINIGLQIDEEGIITITRYSVSMDTWLTAYKKGKETRYKWKVLDSELFKLKNEIQGGMPHSDLNSLDNELVNMLNDITEMYSFALSAYL